MSRDKLNEKEQYRHGRNNTARKRIKTQVGGKRLVRPKGRLQAARCSSNTYSKTGQSRSWRTGKKFFKLVFNCQKGEKKWNQQIHGTLN